MIHIFLANSWCDWILGNGYWNFRIKNAWKKKTLPYRINWLYIFEFDFM